MTSVSVIIPTRNRPQFLKMAVHSVVAQSHAAREIIIVDDGEGASETVRGMSCAIQVIGNHQRGPVAARNLGIATATSDVIAFLDDDDWWTDTTYLGKTAEHFKQGADLCFGDGVMVFADGRPALAFAFPADAESLTRDNTMLISAVSYRRSLHATLGHFDQSLPFYWDWDWYLRVAQSGARLMHHEAPVVAIRVHAQNMSGAETERQRQTNLEAFARKHGLTPLVLKNHLSILESGLS